MRLRNYRLLGVTLWAAIIAAPSSAGAQAWLSDRDNKVGPGFRTGNLEVHPGIGAEAGFQNNVFYQSNETESSPILRVVPHVFVSTLGTQRTEGDQAPEPPKVSFRGGVSGGFYHYLSVERDDVPIEFNADADLLLMPERPFSLGLTAEAGRSIRWTSPVESTTGTGASQSDFGRTSLTPGARVILQTRGGILKTEISGKYSLVLYDEGLYEGNETNEMRARALTTWSLFPKTALFHETGFRYRTFSNDSPATSAMVHNDGWMLSNRVGVNGAVTRTIGTTLAVGYGAGFFDPEPEADDFDDVLLQAILRWSPSERSRWSLGYTRNYELAFQGNYSRSDRVAARVDNFFGGTFLLSLEGAFTLVTFGPDRLADTNGANGPDRSDTRLDAGINGEYRFTDWLAVTGAFRFEQLISDYLSPIVSGTGAAGTPQPVEWTNVEAWVGVRAFW